MPTVPTPMTLDSGVLAASAFNSGVRDPLNFLLSRPKAFLYQQTLQSVSTSTWTAVTWDGESVDTADGHSTSTSTSRYTAQYSGYYMCQSGILFAGSTTGKRGARFAVNGTAVTGSAIYLPASVSGIIGVTSKSIVVYLALGDYVETQAFQDSGGSLDTYVGAAELYSSMTVFML